MLRWPWPRNGQCRQGGPPMQARRVLTAALVALGMIGATAVLLHEHAGAQEPAPILGMVRRTEIHVAPEIGGRLVKLAVQPGQHVGKGDVLAVLDNAELAASVEEAK